MDNADATETLIEAAIDRAADELAETLKRRRELKMMSDEEWQRLNPLEQEDHANELNDLDLRLYELCEWIVELSRTDLDTGMSPREPRRLDLE